ncbi:MAG: hypothetical protein GU357_01095 [Thermofilum sp.]|jgi:hypothetical protein|nr:hypothetical protein [Thermofilum sp.]
MSEISEEVKIRDLKPYNVLVACFLAGFRENGVLNFGILRGVAENTGRKIYEAYSDVVPKDPKSAAEWLLAKLEISKDSHVVIDGSNVRIRIKSRFCRYCPKGVGGLELPGVLCPFPGLFKGFLESASGIELAYTQNGLYRDEENYCNIILSFKEQPKQK